MQRTDAYVSDISAASAYLIREREEAEDEFAMWLLEASEPAIEQIAAMQNKRRKRIEEARAAQAVWFQLIEDYYAT